MKAGLLDQIMACSINYRQNTNKKTMRSLVTLPEPKSLILTTQLMD